MLLPPTRLARTKDGKRYIFLRKETSKYVVTQGEVFHVSGLSAKFGPPKKFLADQVTIEEAEYDAELLEELWKQNEEEYEMHLRKKALNEHKRLWLNVTPDGYFELTDHARAELFQRGHDIAADYLCDNPDPQEASGMLQDMAADAAAYDYDLTRAGIPEGHGNIIREIAADEMYGGMLKAMSERDHDKEPTP